MAFVAGCAIFVAALAAPARFGGVAPAAAQVSAEFQEALSDYGHWERHPRWGEVWVPDDVPPDWRPYEYGHWVYTDEWGWYWISNPEEEDWGWVVYHYGRWAHDRQFGWFWIPGDEWGPAWVDWRYGDDYVGWAPLPPDELIDDYDEQPDYWVFIAPRYITVERPRTYFVPRERHEFIFRRSHVINRTLRFEHRRAAVNPGLSPAFVARATRRPLPTYRVSPHVLAGTQGVAGAVRVSPQQLRTQRGPRQPGRKPSPNRVNVIAVQRTNVTIKPAAGAAAPQPLGKNERGRLGANPPRAAQGATVAPLPQQPAKPPQPQPQQPPKPAQVPQQPAKPLPPPTQPAKPTPPPTLAPQKPPAAVTPPQQPRIERREEHRPPPPVAHPAPPPVTKPAPPVQPRIEHRELPPAKVTPQQQPRIEQREERRLPPPVAKPAAPAVKPPAPPHPVEAPKPQPPKAQQPHPAQAPKAPLPKGEPPAKKAPGRGEEKKSNEPPPK